ncbi:ketohexokinase-like [Ischnura elegans]|uniref:ketohexokinase-like n=1 Tax=Ischnura elegans TaxID=197161 RepID=UPI001ED8B724|nr:ketohexokinase-like [Ischnura elegans]
MSPVKPTVLCVGLVCLDIIQECSSFPVEDSDQRCLGIRWQRGGNASNNCTVLSQIDSKCEFLGSLSSHHELSFIKRDFESNGICIDHCPTRKACDEKSFLDSFPVSTVLINSKNGSRTIIHSKGDIPEITVENFKDVNFSDYSWIHFEGRNIDAITTMMDLIRDWRDENGSGKSDFPTISVELEKPKPGLLSLAKHADVIFIGKDFALYHGWNAMETAIEGMSSHVSDGAVIVCTWGEQGCSATYLVSLNGNGVKDGVIAKEVFHCQAYPPREVVDTLAAGDTFVSGFIRAVSAELPLPKALEFASKLAGAKVGMRGFSGIRNAYLDILKDFPQNSL